MDKQLVAKELLKAARDLAAGTKKFKCIEPGRVEVVKGEARSADAKRGDMFVSNHEDNWRYYGILDIKGSMFRHDPGLSGRPTRPGVFGPGDMMFAILKENVGPEAKDTGFWAIWEEA